LFPALSFSCSGLKENNGDSDISSDEADSPSRYEGAEFKSSLKNFELSESKRTRLRELEVSHSLFPSHILTDGHSSKANCVPRHYKSVCILQVKVMNFQDELESGKRQRKSSMNLQQQVQHYRNRLLQKVHTTLKHNQLQQRNIGLKKIDNCGADADFSIFNTIMVQNMISHLNVGIR